MGGWILRRRSTEALPNTRRPAIRTVGEEDAAEMAPPPSSEATASDSGREASVAMRSSIRSENEESSLFSLANGEEGERMLLDMDSVE